MSDLERHSYDVLVIGAGGAGLRAAIEAREQGMRTAIICKSLFGKAHTVMAEGGAAAAMGNVNDKDSWQVHFRDTLRGGKFLNNPRMAELHAREAPDRVWELETYGALFDRTPDGRISQRNFGGHEYPRLAHVGDRTGLEMIRTLQQKIVSLQQDDAREHDDPEAFLKIFAECTVTDLLLDGESIAGALGYRREDGVFLVFEAPAVILATGGIGKSFKVTSNSWEYTGDGHALALRAGATLINMEFVQFHPTGMVWPPSVKGILVTESVRGDGGVLRNSEGKRFMFDYIPEVFTSQYATSEEEADRWYTDPDTNKRPPELLPRDEVARAINTEVKEGRGSPHGGVFLDVSTRMPAEEIIRRLPSMHHQFKELADVDITAEAMEVGPTCHYVMGGVEVDADTTAARVPGLFAAGEVAGGMHGSNRLGGNSLSDLLVFGRRAGGGAADYVRSLGPKRPVVADGDLEAAQEQALEPFADPSAPMQNPYAVHAELQESMNELVGIIRTEDEITRGAAAAGRVRAPGRRRAGSRRPPVQPRLASGAGPAEHDRGLALRGDGRARADREPRRAHPRGPPQDGPAVARGEPGLRAGPGGGGLRAGRVRLSRKPVPQIRADLLGLFDEQELGKYLTAQEMPEAAPERTAETAQEMARGRAGPDDGRRGGVR